MDPAIPSQLQGVQGDAATESAAAAAPAEEFNNLEKRVRQLEDEGAKSRHSAATSGQLDELDNRVRHLEEKITEDKPASATHEQLKALETRVGALEKKKAWLASIVISVLSLFVAAATFFLPLRPLSLYIFRRADLSIDRKGDNIRVRYDPRSKTIDFAFDVTVLNSGSRDGQMRGEAGTLISNSGTPTSTQDRIPFDRSDIKFTTNAQVNTTTVTIPKGDTRQAMTCKLDYQIGSIGRAVLGSSGSKLLTVRLMGASRPLVITYLIDDWNPDVLNSSSPTQKVFYVDSN